MPRVSKVVLGKHYKVLIGVPPEETDKRGTKLEDIALWVENGVPERYQPSRPFLLLSKMKMTVDKEIASLLLRDPEKCGEKGAEIVRETMETTDFQPLSESTLYNRKRRGITSTQPTIDTGSLRDSIASEVIYL